MFAYALSRLSRRKPQNRRLALGNARNAVHAANICFHRHTSLSEWGTCRTSAEPQRNNTLWGMWRDDLDQGLGKEVGMRWAWGEYVIASDEHHKPTHCSHR